VRYTSWSATAGIRAGWKTNFPDSRHWRRICGSGAKGSADFGVVAQLGRMFRSHKKLGNFGEFTGIRD